MRPGSAINTSAHARDKGDGDKARTILAHAVLVYMQIEILYVVLG